MPGGPGDFVSGLIMKITGVMAWLIGVLQVYLLSAADPRSGNGASKSMKISVPSGEETFGV